MTMRRNLIYDVGAHKGEDTEYYLSKGFKVVAVEASPRLAQYLEDRFADQIAAGWVTVVPVAVTETRGPVRFYDNPGTSVWGTVNEDWARRNEQLGSPSELVEVKGVPFADIVACFGIPYYLKIDIEGSDVTCLNGLELFDDRPRYVSIESSKASWSAVEDEFTLLESLGYTSFKVVPQHLVSSQRPPFPAREGRFTGWRFAPDSSGQFGDEAPGQWVSRDQALEVLRPVFMMYALFGDDGLVYSHPELRGRIEKYCQPPAQMQWYDTHARLY